MHRVNRCEPWNALLLVHRGFYTFPISLGHVSSATVGVRKALGTPGR